VQRDRRRSRSSRRRTSYSSPIMAASHRQSTKRQDQCRAIQITRIISSLKRSNTGREAQALQFHKRQYDREISPSTTSRLDTDVALSVRLRLLRHGRLRICSAQAVFEPGHNARDCSGSFRLSRQLDTVASPGRNGMGFCDGHWTWQTCQNLRRTGLCREWRARECLFRARRSVS